MSQTISFRVVTGGQHITPGQIRTIQRRKTPTASTLGQRARFAYLCGNAKERAALLILINELYSRVMERYDSKAAAI